MLSEDETLPVPAVIALIDLYETACLQTMRRHKVPENTAAAIAKEASSAFLNRAAQGLAALLEAPQT